MGGAINFYSFLGGLNEISLRTAGVSNITNGCEDADREKSLSSGT